VLLAGIMTYNIARLQRAQNNAAKVVCQASRCSSPRPLLKQLHWHPVQQRIEYKTVLLTFKALQYALPH